MRPTLQALLDEHAAVLAGRDRERALLADLADGDRPLFACVHGIAGVGKSALLRAFATDARERGARVLAFDGGAVEPTPAGFLRALGAELGRPLDGAGDVAGALGGDRRTVLVLDGYERLRLLDPWIRRALVPALPATARLLIAGREAPGAWRREFGGLARFLRLENLPPSAAHAVLRRAGVDAAAAARVNRLAQGHPLALQLAAGALADRTHGLPEDAAAGALVDELAALYLAGLDAPTRRALDAAAVVRRTTRSLLAAMLPGEPAADAFERLRALPFVELGREGLVVHDTMREVTTALLRAADPATHRRHRTAAWAQLRRELRDVGRAELWRYTADMLYLLDAPVVREAFFPTGGDAFVVEPATAADGAAVAEIGARHEPADSAALLGAWWRAAPDAFRVARAADGSVAGFAVLVERDAVPHRLYAADPVAAAWREHLRRDPVPRGAKVLLVRWALTADSGRLPGPAMSALWLDGKRDYLELRPALRRVYLNPRDPEALLPSLGPVGFALADAPPVAVGDVAHRLLVCDFGPGSTDGWLAAVVGRELGSEEEQPLDPARRQLVLDGARVDLTRLEWETLTYLRAHEGRPVERAALLRDVWGHDWTGGSNVVEVVVSALRRKLGARAGALQTVRGVGYRLDPLEFAR